ncbi:MAG: ribosomal protein S18-alanine N-acetyltransferase [Desulfovibrio sp.]|jgi:ribosomal-protein-alanine N-acetyltransferase|nr:ribosomal protein S18-alanine N-acetyltransferase [Desulfovibrio sp.]
MQHTHDNYIIFLPQEKDASELAALEAACFSTPWSEAQYKILLSRNTPSITHAVSHAGGLTASSFLPEQTPSFFSAYGAVSASPDVFRSCPPAMPVFGMRSTNGELAAYICCSISLAIQEAEIYTIAVRAPFRRQGLGRRLLSYALQAASHCGIRRALLEVRPSNTPALALYASMGFAICGSRKKYYTDSGENALILACDLDSVFA